MLLSKTTLCLQCANGAAHVLSPLIKQTHPLCSVSVFNPRAYSTNYRHCMQENTHTVHCVNLMHMQYSNNHTFTNTQLRESNQQSNIRSEDIVC